jgi:hypothetical protein
VPVVGHATPGAGRSLTLGMDRQFAPPRVTRAPLPGGKWMTRNQASNQERPPRVTRAPLPGGPMGDCEQPADPTRAKRGAPAKQALFGKAAKSPAGGNYTLPIRPERSEGRLRSRRSSAKWPNRLRGVITARCCGRRCRPAPRPRAAWSSSGTPQAPPRRYPPRSTDSRGRSRRRADRPCCGSSAPRRLLR